VSPAAREQRRQSRMKFHRLRVGVASRLAARLFGLQLAAASINPGGAIASRVLRYQSPYNALVRGRNGKRQTIISSVPLRTPSGRPVDLRLVDSGSRFVPAAPAVRVTLPRRLGDGIAVGSASVAIKPAGADHAGERVSGNRIFYPSTGPDVDAIAEPTVTGAELFWVLRSRLSPENLSYRVVLPAGAALRVTSGGIDVARGGTVLAHLSPALAHDAQGRPVSVQQEVSGDRVSVRILHRRADLAYPILVDPQFTNPSPTNWTFSLQGQTPMAFGPWQGNAFAIVGTCDSCTQVFNGDWGVATWTLPPAPDGNPYGIAEVDFNNIAAAGPMQNDACCHTAYMWEAWTNLYQPFYNGDAYWGKGGNSTFTSGRTVTQTCPTVLCYPEIAFELNAAYGSSGGLGTSPTSYSPGTPPYVTINSIVVTAQETSGSPGETFGPNNPAEPYRVVCRAGRPVNCATGNQYETQTDIAVPFHHLSLGIVRTYNSQVAAAASTPGVFGYGWSSFLDAHLTLDQANAVAKVYQPGGSETPFAINADGTFFRPGSWVEATLTKQADGTYVFTLPDRTSMTFDGNGRVVSEADRDGNAIVVGYNGAGQATSLTDGAGRSVRLTYNGVGTVATATDPAGQTVSYGYDGSGNLASVTDQAGGVWQFGYADHQLTSETEPNGGTTTTSYDASHRVVSQTDPARRTTTWSYSSAQNETLITYPNGNSTDELFDQSLQPIQITTGKGTSVASTKNLYYNSNGLLTTVTDGNQHAWNYTYDANGNRTSSTDPLGNQTSWTYDAHHDVTSTTTPLGHLTTTSYNAAGDPTSVSRTVVETGQTQTTTNGYDSAGNVTSATDPLSHVTTYAYDAAGNEVAETDSAGNVTTYGYDSLGRRVSEVLPSGNAPGGVPAQHQISYAYDNLGDLTSTTDQLGHTTTYEYDRNRNRTTTTDPDGHTTTYAYDPDGERTSTTRADGSVLGETYDNNGNLTSQTNGLSHTTSYSYNALNQVTSRTDPLSRRTTYTYDAGGNLTTVNDPSGRTTTYGYDNADRRTSITYSDGKTPNVSYSYDADGDRTAMTDGSGTTSYGYDSLDRLVSTTNGAGRRVAYAYDLAGNVSAITYPGTATQTVSRRFDADNRLASVTDWLGNTTAFTYDPDSNLTGTTFPRNTDTYRYDNADRMSSVSVSQGTTSLAAITDARDPAGLLTSEAQTALPGPASASYAYTALAQLQTANGSGYAYNAADDPTQLAGISGYTHDNASELTASPSATYANDALGERISYTPTARRAVTYTYAYDQAGRLVTVTPSTGKATTYTYNADGLRTSKGGSTTSSFTWDEQTAAHLLLADGANSYLYGPTGLPIEQISQTGVPSYLHHDQLGSTRLITSSTGSTVGSFTYNPYGSLNSSTGTVTTPLGYAGQYTDSETGFIYLRARYYDSQTAQFLTRDPLERQTRQAYAYANDDPINSTDPSGLCGTGSIGGILDCVNPVSSGNLAYQGASAVGNYLGSHTVGVCLNLSAGAGGYGSASGCVALSGGTPTVLGTLGLGASNPGASATVGLLTSNATQPSQLNGWFGVAGVSGDLGLSVGDEFSGGNSPCGFIGVNQATVGVGLALPVPIQPHGGASYTWTASL